MELSQRQFNVMYSQGLDACIPVHVLQYIEATNSEITDDIALLNSVCERRQAGWMTCDCNALLKVSQSYQDDGWVIMKGCVQWNLFYGWTDFRIKRGWNP